MTSACGRRPRRRDHRTANAVVVTLQRLTPLDSKMVPRRGLEPPRFYPLVPETSASTNSATWAGADAERHPFGGANDTGRRRALSTQRLAFAGALGGASAHLKGSPS